MELTERLQMLLMSQSQIPEEEAQFGVRHHMLFLPSEASGPAYLGLCTFYLCSLLVNTAVCPSLRLPGFAGEAV